MSRVLITNTRGEIEVDPFDVKGEHERWLKSITKDGVVNFRSLTRVSAFHSEMITKYVLDLAAGKNTAKGHKKGPRSYIHLVQLRKRLDMQFRIFERETKKYHMDFTEDEILSVFQGMRSGTILTYRNIPYLDVSTYAKVFCAFWRWYMRTQKKLNIAVMDVVESLDTAADKKPKWQYFTIKDVEKMSNVVPYYEYKALIYFLFDSGIRAPKEMMNVRVMDLTNVPDTNQYFLYIREETSKTFGRKIKLMICSDILRKYIAENNLRPEDFLFSKSPVVYNRVIAKLGYKILKIGRAQQQRKSNGQVHKTLIRGGITMYDFRHNSVCHYLPIYKSENQMKYRYGWKKSDMIHYYSEFTGMKDTISDDDMITDTTKTQLEQALQKEQQKVNMLEEKMNAEKQEMREKIQQLETMMIQRFSNNF